ncbi:hypothetical protein AB3X89_06575 [Paraburkholderia sp. BR14320]|uniref:hypothetical protein n=1 Tax=Paraburkholderia sp. BR14320 TaxID=3237006 RepID=UPI0034CF8765
MRTNGPGAYEDACTLVRESIGATGVVLIVFDGPHGHGLSVDLPPQVMPTLPGMLRAVADDIEAHIG